MTSTRSPCRYPIPLPPSASAWPPSRRPSRIAAAATVAGAWGARAAVACDACTGDPTGALRTGTQAGILAMLGFIAFVLMGIAFVGGFWLVRARRVARDAAAHADSSPASAD